MLLALFILFVNIFTMCLHPIIDQNLSNTADNHAGVYLEDYDNCDYVYRLTDVKKNDLVVIQPNIRGISSKKSQLIDLRNNTVVEKNPDIMLLSETWLTPFSLEFSISSYSFIHQCRQNKKGGGVGILVSNDLKHRPRPELSSEMTKNECITIDIMLHNGEHCLVSSMYRPPNGNGQSFLGCYNSILCQLKKENPKTIIVGLDHNLDLLKSSQHMVTNEFIQSNLDFGLMPTITKPTRITQTSATLIDNIIVSQNLCGSFTSSVLINDISDHLPTVCIIPSMIHSKKEPVVVASRDTRPKNMKALKRQLSAIDWNELTKSESCSENLETFTNILSDTINRCTPECTRHINHKRLQREPWLTPGLKQSIDKNKRLYGESLKSNITHDMYKTYNSTLRKTLRKAKTSFYKDKCREFKTQMKKLWKLINEIAGKHNDKSNLVEYLKVGDLHVYSAKKISNSFAKYFSEVGKKFADRIPTPSKSITEYLQLMESNTKSIFLAPTDENEIKIIATELLNKMSSGHDQISNVLLKETMGHIVEPLSHIFNQSILNGEFPDSMKLADVVPLYKNKEHYLESNYRPISLFTTILKILEKIVYKCVYEFLVETSQLYENQFGF